jgi:penicillin V acylase-like amidase (Ntn superfamily)
MQNFHRILASAITLLITNSIFTFPTQACTRAVYLGSDGVVITGRSMDWCEDMHSNLWSFPRGITRDGSAGINSIKWKAKYGSLVVSSYEVGTADGMNETGLVANVLYLVESDYGKTLSNKPKLSIALWAQYALDNFSSVQEAVEQLQNEPFQIIAPLLPNGSPAQLHLAVSDPTGDSAIFEYINGKLVVHHGKQYQVMTNSPNFDDQLALNKYWSSIGGQVFLPGTSRASDRFARTAFLIDAIPKKADKRFINAVPNATYVNQAVASVLSVMRSISVPLGVSTPGQPNIASTLWRTIADQKNKVYFFDSSTSPNAFWIPLSDLDFKEGSSIQKLDLAMNRFYAGNPVKSFKAAKSFDFLPAK